MPLANDLKAAEHSRAPNNSDSCLLYGSAALRSRFFNVARHLGRSSLDPG